MISHLDCVLLHRLDVVQLVISSLFDLMVMIPETGEGSVMSILGESRLRHVTVVQVKVTQLQEQSTKVVISSITRRLALT